MVEATGETLTLDAAALPAVAADPVRLTLLKRLAASGTLCVCELQPDPPIPANLLSYHLRMLRVAGLATTAKRGGWVDYTREALAALGLDAEVSHVRDVAEIASYGIMRTPGLVVDEQVVLSGRVAKPAEIADLLTKL